MGLWGTVPTDVRKSHMDRVSWLTPQPLTSVRPQTGNKSECVEGSRRVRRVSEGTQNPSPLTFSKVHIFPSDTTTVHCTVTPLSIVGTRDFSLSRSGFKSKR